MAREFDQYIETVIQPWLKEHVRDGYVTSEDGLNIHYYKAINPKEKAAVVMVHGFCGFFGKYHETAYQFYEAGYSIFFVELRGHGYSDTERQFEDTRVYVEDFDHYVMDLNALMVQVVARESLSHRYYLYSHSMGGCVATLYLEQYPEAFTCAVLSSPMLQVNFGKIPGVAVDALAVYSRVKKNEDAYAPNQSPFNPEPDFEHSSCMDEDRYMYQFNQRLADPHYQTSGSTWGWVIAAKNATERALKNAGRVITPVLLTQAGADTMVRLEGQRVFDEKNPKVTLVTFDGARHELYNASDSIRNLYYSTVLTYFNAYNEK